MPGNDVGIVDTLTYVSPSQAFDWVETAITDLLNAGKDTIIIRKYTGANGLGSALQSRWSAAWDHNPTEMTALVQTIRDAGVCLLMSVETYTWLDPSDERNYKENDATRVCTDGANVANMLSFDGVNVAPRIIPGAADTEPLKEWIVNCKTASQDIVRTVTTIPMGGDEAADNAFMALTSEIRAAVDPAEPACRNFAPLLDLRRVGFQASRIYQDIEVNPLAGFVLNPVTCFNLDVPEPPLANETSLFNLTVALTHNAAVPTCGTISFRPSCNEPQFPGAPSTFTRTFEDQTTQSQILTWEIPNPELFEHTQAVLCVDVTACSGGIEYPLLGILTADFDYYLDQYIPA